MTTNDDGGVNLSLALFVLSVVVTVLVLLLDWYLYTHGHDTVSDLVWRYPWLGVPLLAWQGVGMLALGWHFWGCCGARG